MTAFNICLAGHFFQSDSRQAWWTSTAGLFTGQTPFQHHQSIEGKFRYKKNRNITLLLKAYKWMNWYHHYLNLRNLALDFGNRTRNAIKNLNVIRDAVEWVSTQVNDVTSLNYIPQTATTSHTSHRCKRISKRHVIQNLQLLIPSRIYQKLVPEICTLFLHQKPDASSCQFLVPNIAVFYLVRETCTRKKTCARKHDTRHP